MLANGPTEQETSIIEQHFQYLKDLVNQGIVLTAGRTLKDDEDAFGIVVFEAEDEISAQMIVDADPAVAENVMKAKLYPFSVALWSSKGPTDS